MIPMIPKKHGIRTHSFAMCLPRRSEQSCPVTGEHLHFTRWLLVSTLESNSGSFSSDRLSFSPVVPSLMHSTQRPSRWTVILAFGLVYLFWGSTYLGIDIAVQTIPPALMCGLRFSVAGVVMLAVCAATGHRILYSPRQIALAAIVGLLLLMGGNLTLSYAELTVSSGLSALIIAITPLWFLVLDSLLLGDHHISGRGKAGLGLGIVGLFVLVWPDLQAGSMGRRELWASLSLIGGSFSWALGSVLSKKWQSGMDVFGATGWQVTAAGVGNLLFALLNGDLKHATWAPRSLAAVGYLVVCGSWIGYTAYIWLLEHVPTSKVSTYAYVNPVVAVFLGWLVLHEKVDRFILAGSAIVVLSVILVTSAKVKEKMGAEEMAAVEAAGD
jgi:drug/metabolite transporter (DMT)-like permease